MCELAASVDQRAGEYIARVLSQVRAAEAAGFTAIVSDSDFEARWPMAHWASIYDRYRRKNQHPSAPRLFRDDAHPWAPSHATTRGYRAGGASGWDFIRHEYAVDDFAIVLFDGVNEALVRLPGRGRALSRLSAPAQQAEITRIASALFDRPWNSASWVPRGHAGGIAFTTAPFALPTDSWAARKRMDALVTGPDLHFLFYQLHADELETRMVGETIWFTKP